MHFAFTRVKALNVIDEKGNVVRRFFPTSLGLDGLAQRLVLLPGRLMLKIK